MGSISSKEAVYDAHKDKELAHDGHTDKSNQDDRNKGVKSNTVCLNCSKETQTDVPVNDVRTSVMCSDQYKKVQMCMETNQGQISTCSNEWKEFQDCHDARK